MSAVLAVLLLAVPAAKARPTDKKPVAAEKKADKKPERRPDKKATWVALVQVDAGLPTAWAQRLRAAAEADRAISFVPPPAVSLEEAQLALGCSEWGPACAAQIAATSGAQQAIAISLRGTPGAPLLEVLRVKADGASMGDVDKVALPGTTPEGLKIAEGFVRAAMRGARPTILIVTTDVPGAEVLVDGALLGRTPLTAADAVAPGAHDLLLRLEGRAPVSRRITLEPGEFHREHGVMSSGGPPRKSEPVVGTPAAAPEPTTPAMMAIAGWSLTGIGAAVAVGGAIGSALSARDWSSIIDPQSGGYGKNLCTRDGDIVGGALCGDGTEPIEDQTRDVAVLNRMVGRYQGRMTTALVALGAGVLVAATGVALALTMGAGEEADATATATASPETH